MAKKQTTIEAEETAKDSAQAEPAPKPKKRATSGATKKSKPTASEDREAAALALVDRLKGQRGQAMKREDIGDPVALQIAIDRGLVVAEISGLIRISR